MHVVTILALLFALVFGLISLDAMVGLHMEISTMTTGGFAAVMNLMPVFWWVLIGATAAGAVIVAAKYMLDG